MLLERGILTGRKNKIVIGFDLGDRLSQISFSRMDGGEPETLSVTEDGGVFCFPTVIGRRFGANPWVCGIEAADLAAEGRGIVLEQLVGIWAGEIALLLIFFVVLFLQVYILGKRYD